MLQAGSLNIYRCHSQWSQSIWYKSKRFFTLLFQLLPIIGFMAPPFWDCTWY